MRAVACAAALLLGGCTAPVTPRAVLEAYRAQAHALYGEAHTQAQALHAALETLTQNPSAATLAAARSAWRAARTPYSQSEALRFGNWFVDEADARINPWPVDEGFLDYVAEDYAASPTNPHARLNLVSAPDRLTLGGQILVTTPMQRITLKRAQDLSDAESNLATGYHAIEFLLWGQDRDPHGAGQRPWTDYANDARCTDGPTPAPSRHCQRRAQMLLAASEILQQDLQLLAAQWSATPGSYGMRLVDGEPKNGLRRILFGLVTMSAQELAGERMQTALYTNAQEEEQDCFSDDTHRSLFANAAGIERFYRGNPSASLAALLVKRDADLSAALDQAFARTHQAMQALHAAGERGETFDRLVQPGHPQADLIAEAIAALEAQARLLEQAGAALDLGALNPQGAP